MADFAQNIFSHQIQDCFLVQIFLMKLFKKNKTWTRYPQKCHLKKKKEEVTIAKSDKPTSRMCQPLSWAGTIFVAISYTGSYSASVYPLGLAISYTDIYAFVDCICLLSNMLSNFVWCSHSQIRMQVQIARKLHQCLFWHTRDCCIVTSKFNRCYLTWQASQAPILCFEENFSI